MATDVKPEPLKVALARYREPVQRLAAKGVEADFILTSALLCVNQSPELQKCSITSIGQAVMKIAQWGLQPGTTAYLVPFGATCTPVVGTKGLIQLMRECGVRDVDAQAVRDGDVFEWELGLNPQLRHVPGAKRGAIVAAYCIIRLPHAVVKFEVMDAAEINALRQKYSKQWKSGDLPEWYARKTVVRRASKYVPLHSSKLAAALSQDEEIPEADVSAFVEEVEPVSDRLPMRAAVPKLSTGPTNELLDDVDPPTVRTIIGNPPLDTSFLESQPEGAFYDPD